MNLETMKLVERPYREVVDDLLVSIVGGIVNEPIIFDIKIASYPLAQLAKSVWSITGTREVEQDGKVQKIRHTFQQEVDYELVNDEASGSFLRWLEGGNHPVDDTIFYVDYLPSTDTPTSPLTDTHVGSVTRTLSEAIGREIATVYQQINLAYWSGFIDTAEGKSLDLVVAILGLRRRTKDFAIGLITAFRDASIKGNITISEGVTLATTKDEVRFQTTQRRTLQQGQVRIDVPIRATDAFKGESGLVTAGQITQLMRPIAGIDHIGNSEPTYLGPNDESDEELRARAKAALRALGKGTLQSIINAVADRRGKLAEIWDPNGTPAPNGVPAKKPDPGIVALLLEETNPNRFPSLQAAVEETRAAGVRTQLVARYIFLKLKVLLTLNGGIEGEGKIKIIDQVIAALQVYVNGLQSGKPAQGKALLKAIYDADDAINQESSRIVDVRPARADIGQTGTESLVNALIEAFEQSAANSTTDLKNKLRQVVTQAGVAIPSLNRIPDTSLIRKAEGDGAVEPGDVETGNFQVLATIGEEAWWIVLDIDRADIQV